MMKPIGEVFNRGSVFLTGLIMRVCKVDSLSKPLILIRSWLSPFSMLMFFFFTNLIILFYAHWCFGRMDVCVRVFPCPSCLITLHHMTSASSSCFLTLARPFSGAAPYLPKDISSHSSFQNAHLLYVLLHLTATGRWEKQRAMKATLLVEDKFWVRKDFWILFSSTTPLWFGTFGKQPLLRLFLQTKPANGLPDYKWEMWIFLAALLTFFKYKIPRLEIR